MHAGLCCCVAHVTHWHARLSPVPLHHSPPAVQDGIGSICHLCRDPTAPLTLLSRRLLQGSRRGNGKVAAFPLADGVKWEGHKAASPPPIDKSKEVRQWLLWQPATIPSSLLVQVHINTYQVKGAASPSIKEDDIIVGLGTKSSRKRFLGVTSKVS